LPADPRVRTWARVLVLGLAFDAAPAGATDVESQAIASLDACIETLFSQEAEPRLGRRVDLRELCPDLASALRAGNTPRFEWAAGALSEDPTIGELLDLGALVAAPARNSGLRWSHTPAQLSALLEEVLLPDESSEGLGWWDRILAWLRDLVKTPGDADLGWIKKILDAITLGEEKAARILYGVLVLLIAAVVAIFVHELRAIGIFRARRRAGAVRCTPAAPPPAPAPSLSLSGIRDLARQRQPAAILGLCIEELIKHGRLADDLSRTNRELHRSLASGPTATSFGDLVRLAENASYGGYLANDQVLARCYADAERILGAR